jgi:polyhydroxyalkanoate synthase subunit PhaC
LSESGHIAGIVNPPTKKKYGHWRGPEPIGTPAAWKEAATYHEGSWWPFWDQWLAGAVGRDGACAQPGSEAFPPLYDSPGTYVKESVGG